METRKIGSLNVTKVGLGCNNFGWHIDADQTQQVVDAAIDAGINFFDTANIYGKSQSEVFLGKALGKRRKDVIVATKFGMKEADGREGASPLYVRQSIEASLKRLGTDYIDLYQIHKPDPATPIAETLSVLDDLVKVGKVREIGCSQFSAEQVWSAATVTRQGAAAFVSVQCEYSLLHRDPERNGLLEACDRQRLAFIPYFPLASGLLTGKYRRNQPLPEGARIKQGGRFDKLLSDENLTRVEKLIAFAQANGHTLLELAFSWLVGRPTVASVIAGATKPQQVQANVKAADWVLTPSQLQELDGILGQK